MSEKKLILGTANFGQEYRGYKVPQSEQNAIWEYCRQVGIDTVDTATAYGAIEIPEDFKVIMKIHKEDGFDNLSGLKCDKVMIHHREDWEYFHSLQSNFSIYNLSIYTPADLLDLNLKEIKIIQLPINIDGDGEYGGEWMNGHINWFKLLKDRGIEIHARSIFGGGGLAGRYGIKTCLEYVMDIPEIDKIVVGVENCYQLKEIVEVFNGL